MSSLFSTIPELLITRAREQPARRPFTYLSERGAREQTLSYAELDQQARAIGAHLAALAAPGERVILLYPPGMDSVPAFLGALYAGLVAVPVVPPRPGQPTTTMAVTMADAQTNIVLTTAATHQRAQEQYGDSGYLEMFQWIATDVLARETPPRVWQPVTRQSDDLAVLMYTSGSTNFPKGVMLTHANILAAIDAAHQIFQPPPTATMVAWTPLYHTAGLIGSILNPLFSNVNVVILSPLDVLERPAYVLETISRTRAQIVTGGSFLYQWFVERTTPAERANLDLSSLRLAFCGFEPVRVNALRRFADLYEPHGFERQAFCTAYGQSETTLLTTYRRGEPIALTLNARALTQGRVVILEKDASGPTFASCGTPIPQATMSIVNPETRTLCAADEIGEIWAAGPTVGRGYWNNEQATEEFFNAHIADTNEGPFLRSGDLGFFHDGELYVVGRLKDLIIVRGKNFYAQDVEVAVAAAHPALQGGASAAFGIDVNGTEEIVLMHEVGTNAENINVEEIAHAIRATAATTLDLPLYAVVIVAANSLPRTATGKIQRFLCKQEFLDAQQN